MAEEKISGISGEFWKEVVKLTQSMLKEKGLHYYFNPPKNDGSYVKSKMSSGMCFAFALNMREVWIELEIKGKNGKPQKALYEQIQAKAIDIQKKYGYPIRWDKEDRSISGRRESGADYRIKSIMTFTLADVKSRKNNTFDLWAGRMFLFIQAFSPHLPSKTVLLEVKKTRPKLEDTYLPGKSDIEEAESQLRKSASEIISRDAVLDQVEINFKREGEKFKENWREITKRNVEIWFGKK